MTKLLLKSKRTYKVLFISLFLFVILIIYFFNQGYYIGRNGYTTGDEPDYLRGAILIKEFGGPSKFLNYLVSGSYTEPRKHPLYMFVLSFFASKSLSFFVYAKFLNLLLGGLLLVVSFFALRRLFNLFAAIYFALVLSLNEKILTETSLIVPDTFMMLLVLLSLYFYYLGFNDEKKRLKMWILGSFFASLAYLTKPNGILILGAFLVSCFVIYRAKVFKMRTFYVAFFSFLIFSSPLLMRNFVLFKNPFYNDNVSLLWIENRQERRSPEFFEHRPTPLTYFRKIPMVDETKLYGENIVKMLSNFSMLTLFNAWRLRYSLPLLFLTFIGFFLDKDKKRAILLGTFFVGSYLFFAYNYKVSPHFRHEMPLIFIPIGFSSILIKNTLERVHAHRLYIFLVFLLGIIGLISGLKKLYVEGRFTKEVFAQQLDIPEAHIALRNWLSANLNKNEKYVMGLDDTYMFNWYANIKGTRIVQPYFKDFEGFKSYLKEERVTYLIVTGPVIKSFPEIYSKYFRLSNPRKEDYLQESKRPEGWRLISHFPMENKVNFKFLLYDVSRLWKNAKK